MEQKNNFLTKEQAEKFMATPGKIRGLAIKAEWQYVLKKKGPQGIEMIEQEFRKLGYPLKYEEIRNLAFYPVGYDVLSTLIIKKLFNFTADDFYQMGRDAPGNSIIIKLLSKYFVSLKTAIPQAARFWRKYYTFGQLEVVQVDEEKKSIILRLLEFPYATKIACHIVSGYIAQIAQMIVSRETECKETKCMFDGDSYHQFEVQWQ